MVAAQEKALRRLWTGLCDVFVQGSSINPDTGRNQSGEILVVSGQPCRLSFTTTSTTQEASSAAQTRQVVRLFLAPDVEVPPGSKLVVAQAGRTGHYTSSGSPAVYSSHQELVLELFKEWA